MNIELSLALLTAREKECLKYLLTGESAKHIAKRLNVSTRTIEVHTKNIKDKFCCRTITELLSKFIIADYV